MNKEDLEDVYIINRRLKALDTLIMRGIKQDYYVSDVIDYRTKLLVALDNKK